MDTSHSPAAAPPRLDGTFVNNFWGHGDRGYHIIVNRVRDTAHTLDELQVYYAERADIEAEYARRLTKLAETRIGTHEIGHLASSLEALRRETGSVAQSHATVATEVKDTLLPALMAFRGRLAFFRATSVEAIEKTHKIKASQASMVERGRHMYSSERAQAETYAAQVSALAAGSKEQDRVRAKLEQAQRDTKAAEMNYRLYTKALRDTTQAWAVQWRAFLDQTQDMDEERIEFISRTSCWRLVDTMADACVADDRSYQSVYDALKLVSPALESAAFVHKNGTGNMILDPPSADDLIGSKSDHLAYPSRPGFKVARFPRTSNRDSALFSAPAPAVLKVEPAVPPALAGGPTTPAPGQAAASGPALAPALTSTAPALADTAQPTDSTDAGLTTMMMVVPHQDLALPPESPAFRASMMPQPNIATVTVHTGHMAGHQASISSVASSTVLPWLAGSDLLDPSTTSTGSVSGHTTNDSSRTTPSPFAVGTQRCSPTSLNCQDHHLASIASRLHPESSPEPDPRQQNLVLAHDLRPTPAPLSSTLDRSEVVTRLHPNRQALDGEAVATASKSALVVQFPAHHADASVIADANTTVSPSPAGTKPTDPLSSRQLTSTRVGTSAHPDTPLLPRTRGPSSQSGHLVGTTLAAGPPTLVVAAASPVERASAPKVLGSAELGHGTPLATLGTRATGTAGHAAVRAMTDPDGTGCSRAEGGSGRPLISARPSAARPATGKVTDGGEAVQFFVVALYDFEARTPRQFSFTRGDIIGVTATAASGWWSGELLDETRRATFGSHATCFPSNHCALLS